MITTSDSQNHIYYFYLQGGKENMRKKLVKKTISLGLAVAMAVSMAACGKSETEGSASKDNTIPIKWYVASAGTYTDVESVQKAVNEYVADQYDMNIVLQLIFTDFANYPQKMQMVISSGEEYDICWTSNWNNNYYDNINKNAFLELDELLPKEASELQGSIDDYIWNSVKVDEKIYGVPNQQVFFKQNYVAIAKEYVEKYNLDTSKIHKLRDLEEFFLQIKKENPDIYPLAASNKGLVGKNYLAIGFEPLISQNVPGVIALDGTDTKVLNQYEELESLKEFYDLMYSWQQKGIVRQDAATVSDDAVPDIKAGKHVAALNATFKPGVEAIEKNNFGGKDVEFIMLSDAYISTDSMVSSLNAISRTSKNPEVAMKFLNLVNTDEKLYNLLCFGIEDVHYTLSEEGKVLVDDSKGYNPNADWVFGNQFNGLLREGQEEGVWEETKEANTVAEKSRILGFTFDSTSVTNELAAVNAVIDQYALPLETGAVDPDKTLPEFCSKLKAAGCDTVIEELQKQLDAWIAETK